MAFALLIIGVVLITAGVRNTQSQLFQLVQGDFTGDSNFFFWFVSILIIGAIGYVKALKPISTAFLVLVILVLFLTKGNPGSASGGFFAKFVQALQSTTTQSATGAPTPSTSLPNLQAQQSALQNQLQNLQTQLGQNLQQSEAALLQEINQ